METFNEGRPIYYRVERDGLDELHMRGLVWTDNSSIGWFESVGKAVRDRVCLECVSRVGQDSVGREVVDVMERGWIGYI